MFIAAAGPASNFVLAAMASVLMRMVPVPPLDGGNVLAGLLPGGLARAHDRVLRPWGFLVFYGVLLTGALSYFIEPPYLFLSWLLGP